MYARLSSTGFLVLTVTVQCLGQQVKVAQGSNQIDGSRWVTLTVPAQTSYQMANGTGTFTPSLTVRCNCIEKKGKEHHALRIFLDTGGVQPRTAPGTNSVLLTPPKENQVRLLREDFFFRMKLDAAKPERRKWSLLPSSDTVYGYWGEGEANLLRSGTMLETNKLLEKIFNTKVLMIEFQPFGQGDLFVSEFRPGGLKEEFQRHQECSLK